MKFSIQTNTLAFHPGLTDMSRLHLTLSLENENRPFNPLLPSAAVMRRSAKFFYFNLRSDHQKNFLWASRLWVGRQKEPILGYTLKNFEKKKNSGSKGLNKMKIYKFV